MTDVVGVYIVKSWVIDLNERRWCYTGDDCSSNETNKEDGVTGRPGMYLISYCAKSKHYDGAQATKPERVQHQQTPSTFRPSVLQTYRLFHSGAFHALP